MTARSFGFQESLALVRGDSDPSPFVTADYVIGKTVLFSSIVDHILERFPDSTGAYFYCNHDDESRNKSIEVLKSFLVQLIGSDSSNSVGVEYMYNTILAIKTPRSTPKKLYEEMIQTVLKCHDDPWLAIDGLDECEPNERNEILSLITGLVESQELDVGLRVLVASRNEGDIERSLQRSFHLNLTSLQLKGGIGIYVDLEAKKLGRKWQFDNFETQEIYKSVCDRTQGRLSRTFNPESLIGLSAARDVSFSRPNHGEPSPPKHVGRSEGRTASRHHSTRP